MIEQQQIINWLKQNDKRAISFLYDLYNASLYGILLRMLKSEEVAQDVMQETFIKAWKNGSQYDEKKGTLFTWLISIGRNTALNTMKSKAYRNTKKIQSLEGFVDSKENSSLIGEINVNKIGLTGLVNQLDEKYKVIIDLVYFQGYTQSEIEKHLNIPLGTVKSRLKIALRELKILFDYK